VLVREIEGRRLAGRVVEVEAYRGSDDPASHSYRGVTKRNALMFGDPGHAYVYFSYGFHWCLNLTTEGKGKPGAVLLRALEPLEGIEEMERRRGTTEVWNLTSGPGKLTKALGIDGGMNGEDVVTSSALYVLRGEPATDVAASSRIGIRVGLQHQWRYFVKGDPNVSGRKA
jgi:DNA-3-methyladenine glycosylase